MVEHDLSLPAGPPLTIVVEVHPAASGSAPTTATANDLNLDALPAKPGVFVFEDESGGTLALAVTANLRRMVASKLEPVDPAMGRTRRVPYRTLVRTVRAVSVGSAFEADWVYLQLARVRLPQTYRAMLDRWQAWFLHIDPEAAFPQWVKTVHPRAALTTDGGTSSGVNLGPFPDKHAAARYIELLQDAFDLCRYHHILVQAPHATACAYKEMGRCPAPCDGSVSMDSYRARILEAVEFACAPIGPWREQIQQRMQQASAQLDFESARRDQQLLERTIAAQRAEFAHVNLLERLALLAVMPAGRRGWARLLLILGGRIEPIVDLRIDVDAAARDEIVSEIQQRAANGVADLSDAGIENIGMTCAHLFRPRRGKQAGEFIALDDLDQKRLGQALRRCSQDATAATEATEEITDRQTENIAAGP